MVNKALNFESVVDGTNAFVRLYGYLPPDKRFLSSIGKLRKDLHQYHLCAQDLVSKNGHNRQLAKKYRDVSSICSWALAHVRSPQDIAAKLMSHTNAASSTACKWEEANKQMNAVNSWYNASRTRDSSARDVNHPRVVTHHTVLEQQVKALLATYMNFCCLDDTNMAESKGRRCKPPKQPARPGTTDSISGTTDSISAGARKPFENDRLKGATTARTAKSNGGGGGSGEPSLPRIPSGTHNPKVCCFI
jgi:hypothetical protein